MLTKEQLLQLDWQKMQGLLPVIIQHAMTSEVLMLGYMDQKALNLTMTTGKVTFFSRDRQRVWQKGETSGNYLIAHSISIDCDGDALLIMALPLGPTCHIGRRSCFNPPATDAIFLLQLEKLIGQRKTADPNTSYTAKLYQQGIKRIAQKVGEEAVETALAAVAGDKEELINESADLLYHFLILLQAKQCSLNTVIQQLQQRHDAKIPCNNGDNP